MQRINVILCKEEFAWIIVFYVFGDEFFYLFLLDEMIKLLFSPTTFSRSKNTPRSLKSEYYNDTWVHFTFLALLRGAEREER